MPNRDDQTIPAARKQHTGLFGTPPFAALTGLKPNTSIFRASERIDGVRRAESLTSSVIAYAAPTTDIAELVEFGQLKESMRRTPCSPPPRFPPTSVAQATANAALPTRIRDRPEYQNVAVLISNDARTGEKFAKFFKSFAIAYADENNIPITNIARPRLPDLSELELADYEYQFWQGQSRLYDLNSFVLTPPQPATVQHGNVVPNGARADNGGLEY